MGVEAGSAEELFGPLRFEDRQSPQDDSRGGFRDSADVRKLGGSFLGGEEGDDCAQIRKVDEFELFFVGPGEDELEGLFLRGVEAERPRQEERAEIAEACTNRNARELVFRITEGEQIDREGVGGPVLTIRCGAGEEFFGGGALLGEAAQIALHIA